MDSSVESNYQIELRLRQPKIDLFNHNPASPANQALVELRRQTTSKLMERSLDGKTSVIREYKDPNEPVESLRYDPQLFMCYETSYQILSYMLSKLRIHPGYHKQIIEQVIDYITSKIKKSIFNLGSRCKIVPLVVEILVVREYVRDKLCSTKSCDESLSPSKSPVKKVRFQLDRT